MTCYFEGELLRENVPILCALLDASNIRHEVVVVVDGSDKKTENALRDLVAVMPGCRVLMNEENVGRGGSVARGAHAAHGTIVGFIDPDLEILPAVIPPMVEAIRAGADLAIAKRVVPLRPGNALRWGLSKGYKTLANAILKLPGLDTESGCKCFRIATVLPVIDTIENRRWFWDTELVARALHQNLRVVQVPAQFVKNPHHATTVRVVRDSVEYVRELFRLRGQLRRSRRGTSPPQP